MSGSATNPAMAALPAPTTSDFDRDVAWPMWIAGGIAYWPVKDLVLTLDAQFSQWSQSESEFITNFTDPKWAAAATQSGQNKMNLSWKDATQIRFGVGYSATEDLDLRAGFYYDPAPAPDETYNILFPSVTYTGVAVGAGYKVDAFVFDFGAEYLIGKDRSIDALANPKAMPGTHGMNIPAFSLGVGYLF
jgi:long-chain fatty acid transport protein